MLTRKINEYEGQHRMADDGGDQPPESSAAEESDEGKAEKAKVVVEGE